MPEPWEGDVEIGPDHASRVIAVRFPELAPVSVRHLSDGYDFRMYVVNEAYAFRFPRKASVVPSLVRELALLPAIASRVPVEVPRYEFQSPPAGGFPFPFAAYRLLAGDAGAAPSSDATAGQLAQFLSVLHACPADGAPADESMRVPAALRERLRSRYANLAFDPVREFFEREPPAAYAGPRVLVNNDLRPEHVLCADGRIVAVIDWGDLAAGDPAADLACAALWHGPDFLARVIARYDRPLDPGATERARYIASCVTAWVIYRRLRTGEPVPDALVRALAI